MWSQRHKSKVDSNLPVHSNYFHHNILQQHATSTVLHYSACILFLQGPSLPLLLGSMTHYTNADHLSSFILHLVSLWIEDGFRSVSEVCRADHPILFNGSSFRPVCPYNICWPVCLYDNGSSQDLQPIVELVTNMYHIRFRNYSTVVHQVRGIDY